MRHAAGIDIGTAFTKAVIVAENGAGRVLGRGMLRSGVELEQAAQAALALARADAKLDDALSVYVATTGFGRYTPSFRDI